MSAQDTCEKDEKAKNKSEPEKDLQVHSANSWETADLGDKQRNEKFLRLMGAAKKEHHGKIVIGDHKPAHKRGRREEQHLADELADQYEHSMEYRLAGGKRGHMGLGYHPEPPEKKDKPENQELVEESGVAATTQDVGEEDETVNVQEEKNTKNEKTEKSSHKDGGDRTHEKCEEKGENSNSKPQTDSSKINFTKSSS